MSSNLESLILRRLAGVKNAVVAEAIGHDETTVSKISSRERGVKLCELESFFNALGLVVIEQNDTLVTLGKKEYEALRLLARKALEENE